MLFRRQEQVAIGMPTDNTSELLKHYEVYETIGSGNVSCFCFVIDCSLYYVYKINLEDIFIYSYTKS